VDHVEGEEERDLRRALFNGDLLERVELLGVVQPQDRTGATLSDDILGFWTREERRACNLGELPNLFLQAHLSQESLETRRNLRLR
jgi:hypothetical protein